MIASVVVEVPVAWIVGTFVLTSIGWFIGANYVLSIFVGNKEDRPLKIFWSKNKED